MITYTRGNILESPAKALVNPVNTVGVMGKGLALAFKHRYPINYATYAKACRDNIIKTGKVSAMFENGKYIINFPTKQHWRNPSKLEWIQSGLIDLKECIQLCNIKSIAIPALGSGLGGLDWAIVKPCIVSAMSDLSDVDVYIYEPQ